MKLRLNGWQRIGVVLSVLWGIGAAYYESNAINARETAAISDQVELLRRICRMEQDQAITESRPFNRDCVEEFRKNVDDFLRNPAFRESRWSIALAALVPILFGWLLAYSLVGLFKWIRAGFRPRT